MSHHDPHLQAQSFIEQLAGIRPGSPISRALRNRQEVLAGLESGLQSLLQQAGPEEGDLPRSERLAIALFTAILYGDEAIAAEFARGLADQPELVAALRLAAEEAALPGPYGRWPPGPLSAEDLDGPVFRADPALVARIGNRLAAGLEQAHLVALHPRDLGEDSFLTLFHAGWSRREICALNGLVAFLGGLIPVIAGLRSYVLSRHPERGAQTGQRYG